MELLKEISFKSTAVSVVRQMWREPDGITGETDLRGVCKREKIWNMGIFSKLLKNKTIVVFSPFDLSKGKVSLRLLDVIWIPAAAHV